MWFYSSVSLSQLIKNLYYFLLLHTFVELLYQEFCTWRSVLACKLTHKKSNHFNLGENKLCFSLHYIYYTLKNEYLRINVYSNLTMKELENKIFVHTKKRMRSSPNNIFQESFFFVQVEFRTQMKMLQKNRCTEELYPFTFKDQRKLKWSYTI